LEEGDNAAFSDLFQTHSMAVRRLAAGMANNKAEAEDIVSETFFRVLQAVRRGSGPKDHIRAYLLTVARRVCWEWHGSRRDVPVSDDELTYRAGASADTVSKLAERSLITAAFSSLPERWRTVLWQTEVEGEQPAVVGPRYGLTPNATAALARRARQGLRAAYLQAHLAINRKSDVGCQSVTEKLGGYTAGNLSGAELHRVRAHLLGCAECRSIHDELQDVCLSLRAYAGVLVVLVPGSVMALSGGVSGAGSSASTSIGSAIKGFVLGSKVKVGIALASTAAVGAVGTGMGPMLLDSVRPHQLGLSGGSSIELRIDQPRADMAKPEVPQPAAPSAVSEQPQAPASPPAGVRKTPAQPVKPVPAKRIPKSLASKVPAAKAPATKKSPVPTRPKDGSTGAGNPITPDNWRIDLGDGGPKSTPPMHVLPGKPRPPCDGSHGNLKPDSDEDLFAWASAWFQKFKHARHGHAKSGHGD
jgi:RNA polymerase sigma factor (sigma-70 family)